MKKNSAFLYSFILFITIIFLTGCSMRIKGIPDETVNMSPRMISSTILGDFEEIAQIVTPAIVGISADYGGMESVGSGVALSSGGYILTNDHVVSGAKNITVYYANKTSGGADVVWTDSSTDLAIIKATIDMPYLVAGNSSDLMTGRDIIAVGTPLTLQFKHTVTKGIISALNRTIEIDNADGTVSYLQNLIQHDASINPGNSGGPLINANGEVVGINTLKVIEAEGLGFAIPIEVVLPVLNQIIEKGSYKTPYIGLFGLDSSIASFYNKTLEEDGVYIVNIDKKGPSLKAGLDSGDIIKRIDDIEIKTMLDLRANLYHYNIGDRINITYLRNGRENTIDLILSER